MQHIAPYYPYGLMMFAGEMAGVNLVYPVLAMYQNSIYTFTNGGNSDDGYSWLDCKQYNLRPMLRPISTIKDVIEFKGEKFIPIERILPKVQGVSDILLENTRQQLINFTQIGLHEYIFNGQINQLLSMHFDVFGLIDKGLAIDLTPFVD